MTIQLFGHIINNLKPERLGFTEETAFPNWLTNLARSAVARRFELESVQQGAELALAIAEGTNTWENHLYLAFDHQHLLVVAAPVEGETLGDAQLELMAAVELAWDDVSEGY